MPPGAPHVQSTCICAKFHAFLCDDLPNTLRSEYLALRNSPTGKCKQSLKHIAGNGYYSMEAMRDCNMEL